MGSLKVITVRLSDNSRIEIRNVTAFNLDSDAGVLHVRDTGGDSYFARGAWNYFVVREDDNG